MLDVQKIELKNFYSYKEEVIDFSQYSNEIVVIKGKNGAGKSTIFEAIVYGLTGKTIRKSRERDLVNNDSKGSCEVKLHLKDGVIHRGKRPNLLTFVYNGVDYTKDGVKNTQLAINQTLNIDYKTLLASMVFGQHNTVDFLDATPDEKRGIMRSFLSLDDIYDLREIIKDFKSEYNQSAKSVRAVIDELEKEVLSIKSKLRECDIKLDQFSNKDIFESTSLEEIQKMEKDRKLALQTLGEFRLQLGNAEADVKLYLGDIESFFEDVPFSGYCNSCGQKVTRKKPNLDELDKAKSKYEDSSKKVKELTEWIEDLETELPPEPPVSSKELSSFMDFKVLMGSKDSLIERKEEIQQKLEALSVEESKHLSEYQVMRFWEKAFSEQGLIKYVIRNVLDYFNLKCNFYLSYLTKGNFSITFNEHLEEEVLKDGKVVSYFSLSGGEKRKMGFSILLALKSLLLVTGKVESPVLLVDEIGENLDAEGVEGLYNLLQELKKDKTIFLITHDKNLKLMLDSCKRISVIQEHGQSKIYRKDS